MQADEQIGVMRLGEGHAAVIRHRHVAVARQEYRPSVRFQQWREPLGPVEGEFLFQPATEHALRAGIAAAVARVNHDDAV